MAALKPTGLNPLVAQLLDEEPINNWAQGANHLAKALFRGLELRDQKARENRLSEALLGLPGLGGAPPQSSMPPPPSAGMPGVAPPRPSPPTGFAPPAPTQQPAMLPSVPPPDDPTMTVSPRQVAQANGGAAPLSFNDRFSGVNAPQPNARPVPTTPVAPPPPAAPQPQDLQFDPAVSAQINALVHGRQFDAAMALYNNERQRILKQQDPTNDIREYEYARRQGFQGTLEDWMRTKQAGSADEYGLNPVWGTGPDGRPALVQLNKRGQTRTPQMPEGFQPGKPLMKTDTGTEIILSDPITGQVVGRQPKDIAGARRQAEIGKGEGEAASDLASIESKMPGLQTVIRELDDLSNKATYTLTGQAIDWTRRQAGAVPREAAVARQRYISMVDNQILPLLRDTFGAQFTQKEGETLRATLGNPNLSPQEKQAVLKSFIEQKRRDVEALRRRVGGPQAATPNAPAAPSANDPLGLR